MHRPLIWLISLVLALAAAPPVLGQVADEAAVPRMALSDLKKAVDAGQVLVVDVRDTASYADGHIPGAVNIPLDRLEEKLSTLKGSTLPIVTYCA